MSAIDSQNTGPSWPYSFSPEEWQICLDVLQTVAKAPNDVPDLERMKSLVTKVYKQAKKKRRQQNLEQRNAHDNALLGQTVQGRQSAHSAKERRALSAGDFNVFLENKANSMEHQVEAEFFAEQLNSPRRCYVCHEYFTRLHFYYHRLCPPCAQLNYQQRQAKLDLSGHIALVTGGRIKVGRAIVLSLLRQGATVIATTRFPRSAATSFQHEQDFKDWKNRLKIVGLDLLALGALEDFILQLKDQFTHLDILVNNAAQTLWRPREYYVPLLENEEKLHNSNGLLWDSAKTQILLPSVETMHMSMLNLGALDMNNSALITRNTSELTRPLNSWDMELEEIPSREILETQVINSVAPAMLCAQLKDLFERSPHLKAFIINVSSSEGQFDYALKQTTHAHTNMSKAGLNMLTRTAAEHYAQTRIYMNSVDVGWISAEKPIPEDLRYEMTGFVPPLDPEDGAARILHPIRLGMMQQAIWGKLLKDYREVAW